MHATVGQIASSAAVVLLLASMPVGADDVHLENGRVFEDVVASVEGDWVRLHLPFGEMSVPLGTVERIERAETSLEAFQAKRDGLRHDPEAEAADWVALGRWALDRGLRHGAREAALEAARRDPAAEGLASLMQALDYVLDAGSGRWISYEKSLERRGYAHIGGRWLSPEQQLARQEARARAEAEAARAREAAEERRLARAVLALAAAQLARGSEPQSPKVVYPWPTAVFPGTFHFRTSRRSPPERRPDPSALPIERRQPGSLFPIAPSHHGGVARHQAGPDGSRTSARTSSSPTAGGSP